MKDQSKLSVVTGAAGGIGGAVSKRLLEDGGRVVMIDALSDALDQASKQLRDSYPDRVFTFAFDVKDSSAVQTCADTVERDIGAVDCLATCAGVTRSASADKMTFEEWKYVLDINLDGTFLCCQAFGRNMLSRGAGSIVTVTSVAGLGGQAGRANYCSSKWALIGLTKTLAIEWGHRGVRVNAVAPGPVNTPLLKKLPDRIRVGLFVERTPLARASEPSEVADAIAYLLSSQASYINGATLTVDGGLSAGQITSKSGAEHGL